jgi:class 3 adenylate cyclase
MAEPKSDLRLEIAHVLFIDIVGYSKRLIDEQHELLQALNQTIRNTEAFRSAETSGNLIRVPTGDGMALVFSTTPEAPVQCALEISKALRSHSELQVRMGIHSGPVSGIMDVNDRSNIAGAGINVAQRVMDCGDAGHILLSKRVAEDLEQYRQWRPHLHELGECEVKHGARVSLVNLYSGEVGNPAIPEKLKKERETAAAAPYVPTNRRKLAFLASAILVTIALVIGFWAFSHRPSQKVANALTSPEKRIAVLPFKPLVP